MEGSQRSKPLVAVNALEDNVWQRELAHQALDVWVFWCVVCHQPEVVVLRIPGTSLVHSVARTLATLRWPGCHCHPRKRGMTPSSFRSCQ